MLTFLSTLAWFFFSSLFPTLFGGQGYAVAEEGEAYVTPYFSNKESLNWEFNLDPGDSNYLPHYLEEGREINDVVEGGTCFLQEGGIEVWITTRQSEKRENNEHTVIYYYFPPVSLPNSDPNKYCGEGAVEYVYQEISSQ